MIVEIDMSLVFGELDVGNGQSENLQTANSWKMEPRVALTVLY